jgi:lipopolysaccharide heptosyltransferase III
VIADSSVSRLIQRRYSSKPVKILLLQLKRIGDLILTLPALATLRENFPDARLTLVVSNECAGMLPAISNVDRILLAHRNLRDLAPSFAVAREAFDYCIDFTRNDRSAFLAFLSGARRRITSYRVRDQSKNRARVYSDFADVRMRDMHTIDYHLALLEPLGIRKVLCELRLDLPAAAREKADQLRRDTRIGTHFVIFHPASAREEKLWDPARWAQIIDKAGRNNHIDLVLTSGASRREKEHVAKIKQRTQRRVVDLSGKTDLLTLAALIGQARLLVTVDSAPMHLAAATRTPQVILFGPTNPFHWRPRESPALILQGESAVPLTEFSAARPRFAMSQISTAAVINAMEFLLSPHPTAHTS